ncbi:MAG: hypothetical protein IT488_04780 [Gammaproteobacteria bacterium]|nr:hypothetical protein [Gammaproteobacteria bacterium]
MNNKDSLIIRQAPPRETPTPADIRQRAGAALSIVQRKPAATDSGTNSGMNHHLPKKTARPTQEPRRSGVGGLENLATLVFAAAMILLIYTGWRNRAESYLNAESGTGYALGIIGASLMLLLLLYPLRKRVRIMRYLGPVKFWFRSHMILGVVGPICILYHASFKLGSTNSNIALFCMLTVASSGLIGRYFYRKIHHGLYGNRASLKELLDDEALRKNRLAETLDSVPQIKQQLQATQTWEPRVDNGVLVAGFRIILFGLHSHWLQLKLLLLAKRAIRTHAQTTGKSADWTRQQRHIMRRYLGEFFAATRKVAGFSFFERMFSLWHLLHMPLFIMMVITGVIHVIAVHMY